jgi:hypothetical protein
VNSFFVFSCSFFVSIVLCYSDGFFLFEFGQPFFDFGLEFEISHFEVCFLGIKRFEDVSDVFDFKLKTEVKEWLAELEKKKTIRIA